MAQPPGDSTWSKPPKDHYFSGSASRVQLGDMAVPATQRPPGWSLWMRPREGCYLPLLHAAGPSHECRVCSYELRLKASLQAHIRSLLPATTLPAIRLPSTLLPPAEPSNASSSIQSRLDARIEVVEPEKQAEPVESALMPPWQETRTLRTRNFTAFPKSFTSGGNLVGLLRAHTYDASHSNLLRSLLRPPSGQKPYACTECPMRFEQSEDLQTHVRTHTTHNDEKPFACTECPKRFASRGNLMSHVRTHSNKRPFACPVCPKRFGESSHLKMHLRTHTGERPFACPRCAKRFSQKGNLKAHLRIHTGDRPFSCTECPRNFSERGHLMTHMRTHTGEKPLACAECEQRFAHRSSLSRHLRVHDRAKPESYGSTDKSLAPVPPGPAARSTTSAPRHPQPRARFVRPWLSAGAQ